MSEENVPRSLDGISTVIHNAIENKRGDDQFAIAKTGLGWLDMLLRKNKDYGSSVWKQPVLTPHVDIGTAILVRMSDKIERLQQLLENIAEKPEVEESLRDTMKDLGSYCLLWLANPHKDENNDSS